MRVNVYYQGFKSMLQAKLEYRVDFFLGAGAAMALQAASLGTLWVVLNQTPTLAGWTGMQVALLFGLTAMIQGCSELFFNQVWFIPFFIVRGQIDRLLVYPVKSLPFLLVTAPELHCFGNLCGGLLVFGYAAHSLGLPLWVFAALPFWVICGSLIHTSVLVFCGAICFVLMGQKNQHYQVVNQLLQATKYPLGVYPKAFGVLMLIVIPFSVSSYLSVGWVLGNFGPALAFALPPVVAAVFVWLAFKSWNFGLKRYESTGS